MNDTKLLKFLIIGFSGAGKTHYLEQLLAHGESGQDLDQLILKEHPKHYPNTRTMIQAIGLSEFRRLEFAILKNWLESAKGAEYLSLGGGTIHKDSIEWLNSRDDWQAIYIKKSFEECLSGMRRRNESFLLDLSIESVKELYYQRIELYKQLKNIQD